MDNQEIMEVIRAFAFSGTLTECVPHGSGHINDTYRLTFTAEEGDAGHAAFSPVQGSEAAAESDRLRSTAFSPVQGSDSAAESDRLQSTAFSPAQSSGGAEAPGTSRQRRYILQRMNSHIFKNPVELMENVSGVTSWLRKKILENGGDPERETLNLVNTRDGLPYYRDSRGEYWRVYYYIEDAQSYDLVKDENDFYQSAVAFGHFQRLLADYPAETLHETIVNFHNTPDRYRIFMDTLAADPLGRAAGVQEEIRFVKERERLCHFLTDLQEAGKLPLRVTHNDTKLNNIMIDNATGKAICVIDLDTVMPGLSANDFGDSIRFGAATAEEDEPDLSKMSFDLHLYEVYTKGFVEGCAGALTDTELDALPMGAILMTLECGIRFLTDYLDGDHYFKISRPGHNLDRARTQFKLVSDMEKALPEMKSIVQKYKS